MGSSPLFVVEHGFCDVVAAESSVFDERVSIEVDGIEDACTAVEP